MSEHGLPDVGAFGAASEDFMRAMTDLEPALAARPGRIDLALEIPLPDTAARHRLLDLYASDIELDDEARRAIVERTERSPGAFFRRSRDAHPPPARPARRRWRQRFAGPGVWIDGERARRRGAADARAPRAGGVSRPPGRWALWP